jgi:hypothetical protein
MLLAKAEPSCASSKVLATFWNLSRAQGAAPHVSMTGKQPTTLPNCPTTSASADDACLDLLEAYTALEFNLDWRLPSPN